MRSQDRFSRARRYAGCEHASSSLKTMAKNDIYADLISALRAPTIIGQLATLLPATLSLCSE
jgi:hypothetical protein